MNKDTDYGIVFDIKRFALHDGAGIRSTLFTKGCPLRCPWCHNPEGRKLDIELLWFETLCIGCGACVASCPQDALALQENGIVIDRASCVKCGKCIDVCPALALKFDGYRMHYREAFAELIKDKVFFQGSGGGITLSGGDPLVQSEFSLKLLGLCKEEGIHTTIETCLYAPTDTVLKFVGLVDCFYVDIKILDEQKHRAATGVGNKLILHNFEELSARGASICVRIPLIPGYTADDEDICATAEYVAGVNPKAQLELLNYNPLAESKYHSLQERYILPSTTEKFSEEEMQRKSELVKRIMEKSKC